MRTDSTRAEDYIGERTLEIMGRAVRYNRWIAELIRPHLGRRVLEIGAGVANMTPHLLGREWVVATDPDPGYLALLRERLSGHREVEVRSLQLPEVDPSWAKDRLDTAVLLNVLEHVEEDEASLVNLARVLQPGGCVVIFVPAVPVLYGSLDRGLGHVRRYTRRELRDKLTRAGLDVGVIRYCNFLGMLGWWFHSRVVGSRILPAFEVQLFDLLVPVVARLEAILPSPVGQSLLAVGRIPARDER